MLYGLRYLIYNLVLIVLNILFLCRQTTNKYLSSFIPKQLNCLLNINSIFKYIFYIYCLLSITITFITL